MHRAAPGRYVKVTTASEPFQAFMPAPLPPEPAVVWSPALRRRFDAALVALGRLDAVTNLLPNAALLLYSFVRKEAVLSSQIEGTQSSLADLLLYEIDEQPGRSRALISAGANKESAYFRFTDKTLISGEALKENRPFL